MEIAYELDERQVEQLWALYQKEWWTAGRSLDDTRACVAGSQICIGLLDDAGELQGFARVLTDYVFKALVFDVIVAEAYRRTGLGDRLMGLVLEHEALRRVKHFELYCRPEMRGFYERYGFSTEVGGTVLMRRVS